MGFTVGGIERCGILGPHRIKEGKQLFLVDFYSTPQFLSTFAGTDLSFLRWGIDCLVLCFIPYSLMGVAHSRSSVSTW